MRKHFTEKIEKVAQIKARLKTFMTAIEKNTDERLKACSLCV